MGFIPHSGIGFQPEYNLSWEIFKVLQVVKGLFRGVEALQLRMLDASDEVKGGLPKLLLQF